MSVRRPAPPKPPPPPGAPETPLPAAEPEHRARSIGPVRLIITAEVTIPAAPGYARRLSNLIADLKRGVEEQAPWLRNVTVEVDR